jgi:hypothetical protein
VPATVAGLQHSVLPISFTRRPNQLNEPNKQIFSRPAGRNVARVSVFTRTPGQVNRCVYTGEFFDADGIVVSPSTSMTTCGWLLTGVRFENTAAGVRPQAQMTARDYRARPHAQQRWLAHLELGLRKALSMWALGQRRRCDWPFGTSASASPNRATITDPAAVELPAMP